MLTNSTEKDLNTHFRRSPSEVYDPVRVSLLSGFQVSVESRLIDENVWQLKKATNLIELLALAAEHRLQRERVMELLWPNLAPQAASNNLRRTLHVARRALDPSRGTAAGYRILTAPGALPSSVSVP
jgi:DNA-binding SARP family transcriptional activator